MRKRSMTVLAALGLAALTVGLASASGAAGRHHSRAAVATPAIAKDLGQQFGTGFTAKLTGAAEVPPGDPNASGTALIRLNAAEGLVCFKIVVTGANAPIIASHIHQGAAGVAGPVVVPFVPLTPSSTDSNVQQAKGCVSADPALINQIVANPAGFYVNVHNKNFPAGVVRGQLEKLKEKPLKKSCPKAKAKPKHK